MFLKFKESRSGHPPLLEEVITVTLEVFTEMLVSGESGTATAGGQVWQPYTCVRK